MQKYALDQKIDYSPFSEMESLLKIPKLRGSENWDIWSLRMEAVLIEKGYYEVLTTNQPKPEDLAEWEINRKKALAYIRLALEDGPLF